MLMDDLFVIGGIAIIGIILARILEIRSLLLFSGLLFLLAGIQILMDADLQYSQGTTTHITIINETSTEITEAPQYTSFSILGANSSVVVALCLFAFGILMLLKSTGWANL
jgi:hypothetical protein